MKKTIFLMNLVLVASLISACSKDSDIQETTNIETAEVVEVITTEAPTEVLVDKIYDSESIDIKLLGAETFKELTGDKGYIDQAGEGEEYLVVYLEIENLSKSENYFNYNYLNTILDGTQITTTFLLNKPKEYETIFTSLPSKMITQGYLVYKVPVGWKNLKIAYTGWEEEGGEIFECELTPSHLKEVEPYVNTNTTP